MRSAFHKLLASPITLRALQETKERGLYCTIQCRYQSDKALLPDLGIEDEDKELQHSIDAKKHEGDNERSKLDARLKGNGTRIRISHSARQPGPQATIRNIRQDEGWNAPNITKIQSLTSKNQGQKEGWRQHLSTLEQYQYESGLIRDQIDRPLLVDHDLYHGDWKLWLELIGFRRRHYGPQGPQALFKQIFQRDMCMPTKGSLGDSLWGLSIGAGHEDSDFLLAVVSYAKHVKQSTGEAWPKLYYSILARALKTDPILAYSIHVKLKTDFPPSLGDYQKLFQQCARLNSINDFEGLYRDLPLQGMYATVIPELCKMQKFRDAVKWHHLLFTMPDFALDFSDMHPLFAHLAEVGDSHHLEHMVKDLKEAYGESVMPLSAAEKFVRKHNKIGREIMNRQLGEIHGVAPKHLSDSFCARLFATRLFSVDTVISGLEMMAVNTIGPLTLRELVSRDNCDGGAIYRHLARLKDSGIVPVQSVYATLIQNLASKGENALLRSTAECDLHPDTFENTNLQERLLAQYCERDDRLQFERTIAAITVHCKSQDLPKWRLNLILRCNVTLRRAETVISTIEAMKQKGLPITARSSRHLRVCWLSTRRPGKSPKSARELGIIINATMSTLRSRRYVPIVAWKEILRRLGMAGRLEEFENLAIWLVDFYTDPTTQKPLPPQIEVGMDRHLAQGLNTNPRAFLLTLFPIAAQHAIVAWGFQQGITAMPKISRISAESNTPSIQRPFWTWGLVLLQNLQARGVPIHQSTIARICRHRLNTLFGNGISKRPVNRRLWMKNQHHLTLDRWAFRFYLREMKKIWGQDLFPLEVEASMQRTLEGSSRKRLDRL